MNLLFLLGIQSLLALPAATAPNTVSPAQKQAYLRGMFVALAGVALLVQVPVLFGRYLFRKPDKDPNAQVKILDLPSAAQIKNGQVFEITHQMIQVGAPQSK